MANHSEKSWGSSTTELAKHQGEACYSKNKDERETHQEYHQVGFGKIATCN
jgi:hypothetical protein